MKRSRITSRQAAHRIARHLEDPTIDEDSVINSKLASIGYQISPGYASKLARKSLERGNEFPRKQKLHTQDSHSIWQATVREWEQVVYPPDIHIRPTRRGKR